MFRILHRPRVLSSFYHLPSSSPSKSDQAWEIVPARKDGKGGCKSWATTSGGMRGFRQLSRGSFASLLHMGALFACVASGDWTKLVGNNRNFDILVVGLQEAPRSNIAKKLEQVVEETHRLVGEVIMQSLQLYVFGLKGYMESFTIGVRVDKLATGGLGGLIGRKKGAVAMRMTFKRVRMLFISCHLSAHAPNVEERNYQFRHITYSLEKRRNPYARPYHIIVWLGDLNYRIQGIATMPVRDLIQENRHNLLTSRDQLLQEARKGQVFNGFCEGYLTFKPTYKYDVGSSNYDTSYKVRVPSWTDRILYKPQEIGASLLSYESIDSINTSDHKPVRAHICLNLRDCTT